MFPDEPGDSSFYPAHLRPLSFPRAAGTSAADTCERIARLLGDHLGARPGLVAAARDGWEGAFREEFDDTWRVQEPRLTGVQQDLLSLAGRIRTAMANVTSENERRALLREQYLADNSVDQEVAS